MPYLIGVLFIWVLSGCTSLSVVTTGAQAIYDRHDLQKKFKDYYITQQAYGKIHARGIYKNAHVSVATFNGDVLLTGEVPNEKAKINLISLIQEIPHVRDTYDHLMLAAPSSTLTRASDSWITAKVKAQFIAMNDLDPEEIKVVTENGVVYLMGIVTPLQADLAYHIAEDTAGVQGVVKHFYHMYITKA